jgi:hypothetical protein
MEPRLPEGPDVIITTGDLLGLGDHGAFSTLPERFAKLCWKCKHEHRRDSSFGQYDRDHALCGSCRCDHSEPYNVYIDADTRASNPEILELIWEKNPYVKGLSDKKPNAGYGFSGILQGKAYELTNTLGGHRGIECVERANGLPPPYSMAPKIYYTPKPPPIDVRETVIVDYSAVSTKYGRGDIEEEIKMMIGRFRGAPMLQLLHPSWVVLNQEQWVPSVYRCGSIFEYMDFLHACRAWVGSEAGGQMLAAAVRGEHDVYDDAARPEIVCKITPATFNSGMYRWRGVDYRVTANGNGGGYWSPSEVKNYQYHIACKIREFKMAEELAHG